jgi:hypothetical protein
VPRPGLSALAICLYGCSATSPPEPLVHEAYVWQRAWVPGVVAAVADPLEPIAGLRVLAAEIAAGGVAVWPEVSTDALARSRWPITAVVRIDGSRPIAGLSLAPLLDRIAAWRAAGVDVAGVEIDHDCATAALADYAAWLERARPPDPLRLSITALPTWAGSPGLDSVAAAVDELVVQVHAVRAPRIFDPGEARRWLERFAAAVGDRPLRVALPTYAVALGEADPAELSRFVAGLERRRPANLRGVVWFRHPVDGDPDAWAAPTLAAVIAGDPLRRDVGVELVPRGARRFDIAVVNRGNLDSPWPAIEIAGDAAADLTRGYNPGRPGRWTPPPRILRAGSRVVVGWAAGQEVEIRAL